jgi:hypothetical protein
MKIVNTDEKNNQTSAMIAMIKRLNDESLCNKKKNI